MIKYLLEPILSSELLLVNNAKRLKENPSLFDDTNLSEIETLRDVFYDLECRSNEGERGLQSQKRVIRDQIRDLSTVTFVDRDTNLFGKMITTMADRIVTRPQFSNYTFKDDMKALGIQHILLYSWKFDPYKQSKITGQYISAFAYISTIIFNAAIATINKHHLEQKKAKDDFLEHQKLIHRDVNRSTFGADFENPKEKYILETLVQGELLNEIKKHTITEATEFWIPSEYFITEKEYDFIMKYVYNISIRRVK